MLEPIHTQRLILRPFTLQDEEGIYVMDSDPEVHRYLGNNPISQREQARKTVQTVLDQYEEVGIGRLVIEEKKTGEFIGWAGIKYERQLREFPYYDLGYRLRRDYWGQGIGFEAALASMDFGFRELKLPEICAAAHVDNAASNRIIQKSGLQFREQFTHEGDLINWYGILCPQWEEAEVE